MIQEPLLRVSLSLLLVGSAAFAQSPSALPAFEVATIKPSVPLDMAAVRNGQAHTGTKIDAARVDIRTASLFRLICTAYRLRPYQLAGPDWLKTTNYDIQAKIPDGGAAARVPEMLQVLLAERFGLKVHHDNKDQPVYALVVAKGGPKMKESALDAASQPPNAEGTRPDEKARTDSISMPTAQGDVKLTRGAQGISIEMPGGEISGKLRVTMAGGAGAPPRIHLESSGTTMKTFAEMLSVGVVDRPVVDMTGLTGQYEVAVDISQEDAMNVARAAISLVPGGGGGGGDRAGDRAGDRGGTTPGGGASDPSGASIFSSVQNLGLKLEARKLPLDILVIDHIEKTPAQN